MGRSCLQIHRAKQILKCKSLVLYYQAKTHFDIISIIYHKLYDKSRLAQFEHKSVSTMKALTKIQCAHACPHTRWASMRTAHLHGLCPSIAMRTARLHALGPSIAMRTARLHALGPSTQGAASTYTLHSLYSFCSVSSSSLLVHRVRLSLSSCMMSVLSLYDSWSRLSSSDTASSKESLASLQAFSLSFLIS